MRWAGALGAACAFVEKRRPNLTPKFKFLNLDLWIFRCSGGTNGEGEPQGDAKLGAWLLLFVSYQAYHARFMSERSGDGSDSSRVVKVPTFERALDALDGSLFEGCGSWKITTSNPSYSTQ